MRHRFRDSALVCSSYYDHRYFPSCQPPWDTATRMDGVTVVVPELLPAWSAMRSGGWFPHASSIPLPPNPVWSARLSPSQASKHFSPTPVGGGGNSALLGLREGDAANSQGFSYRYFLT